MFFLLSRHKFYTLCIISSVFGLYHSYTTYISGETRTLSVLPVFLLIIVLNYCVKNGGIQYKIEANQAMKNNKEMVIKSSVSILLFYVSSYVYYIVYY